MAQVSAAGLGNVFPPGPRIQNVRDHGAKGDGVTDDTAAIRLALEGGGDVKPQMVYFPNGTYVVTDTIAWPRWRKLVGESRDGVVIRLKDGSEGFGDPAQAKPVLHACIKGPYYDTDSWANAAFGNFLISLTVDTGKGNPGATGARFTTHNNGAVDDVLIRSGDGSGVIGLDLSQTEFGPGAVRNTTIEGFDVGIQTPGISNVAMENITLRGQREAGFVNKVIASIAGFTSENKVPAIRNEMGMLNLLNARLTGGEAGASAIVRGEKSGPVMLENVMVSGYGAALDDKGDLLKKTTIDFHSVGREDSLGSAKGPVKLPYENPPSIFLEDPRNWKIVEPSGADDTEMLQRAFDSGAKTIYLQSGKFQVSDTITVPATVRRVLGAEESMLRGPKDGFNDKPILRLEGGTEPVSIEVLKLATWPSICWGIEIDTPRPVFLNYAQFLHPGGWVKTGPKAGSGKLFCFDVTPYLEIGRGYQAWLTQYNPENNPFKKGKSDPNRTYVINRGGKLWVNGFKTEAPAIHVRAESGSQTAIMGGFFRDHFGGYEVPYFDVVSGDLSAAYVQYAHAPGACRQVQAVAGSGSTRKELSLPAKSAGFANLRVQAR